MRRRALFLPLAAGVLFLAACDFEDFASSDRYSEDFHYNYPLKPGGRISVDNFNGAVQISGWDQDRVDISGAKYAATIEMRDSLKIDIVPAADAVSIRTIRPSERRGNLGVRYVLKVPRRVELERISSSNGSIQVSFIDGPARLRTTNGAIRVMNLKGNLEGGTTNGSVELENIEGSTTIRTTNGRVKADAVRGPFEATTSNGGIHAVVAEAESGRGVKVETSNGSVDLTLGELRRNEVRASTSNGGITVHLPAGANARLSATTSNSSIMTDFEVKMQGTISKHHLEGEIGSGGPAVNLSTTNGSIRVLKQ